METVNKLCVFALLVMTNQWDPTGTT